MVRDTFHPREESGQEEENREEAYREEERQEEEYRGEENQEEEDRQEEEKPPGARHPPGPPEAPRFVRKSHPDWSGTNLLVLSARGESPARQPPLSGENGASEFSLGTIQLRPGGPVVPILLRRPKAS